MEITVLGAAGGQTPGADTTGFLLNSQVLLDAGSIALRLAPTAQRDIRHVLLTHTHLDHLHALPFLLDNLVGRIHESVTVYAPSGILEAVHRHVFNGLMWPDFTRLPSPEAPVLRLQAIEPGRSFRVGEWRVLAVDVRHTVPTVGYLVTGAGGTVAFSGDTGPTDELWRRVGAATDLRAVFVETSFPASQQALARVTGHLATSDLEQELAKAKLPSEVPVFLYHLKPEYFAEITAEAKAVQPWRARPVQQGEVIRL